MFPSAPRRATTDERGYSSSTSGRGEGYGDLSGSGVDLLAVSTLETFDSSGIFSFWASGWASGWIDDWPGEPDVVDVLSRGGAPGFGDTVSPLTADDSQSVRVLGPGDSSSCGVDSGSVLSPLQGKFFGMQLWHFVGARTRGSGVSQANKEE